ncbi:MAG TPA: hypothetical protein VF756_11845 [Thermoanaerobaculia bacterium]
MGEIVKRLLHDDQKDLFEILFAQVLGLVFLALIALLLWPLDRLGMVLGLAKGYVVLWLVLVVATLLLKRIHRWLRVDLYHHANAFVGSNLAVSCFLQAGWSAFAALAVHRFATGVPVWGAVILYLVGALSCLMAFYAVSSFYQGAIYKLVSLPVALVCFVVFSVWPASGRSVYGWFFGLFTPDQVRL